jgi:hypothetical protein
VTTRLVLNDDADGLGGFFAGIAWALNWLGGTALVWRQSAAERAERLNAFGIGTVACPTWGYNLTGDGPEPAEAGA